MNTSGKGYFQKGHDPRRHVFSRDECQKGYLMATRVASMPSRTRAWLRNKLRRLYREKRAAG